MAIHEAPFLLGEFARLGEHVDRDANLADVVQQPGDAHGAHLARPAAHGFGERHRQHRDVQRMRGRVLIELLELQQRHQQSTIAVHGDRQRAHDRFRFEQRHGLVGLDLLLEPAEGLGLLAEREIERDDQRRRGRVDVGQALEPDRTEADAQRAHLPVLAGVDRRQRQSRQDLFEKRVELIAADAIVELEPLNAGADQALRPVPRLQLAERLLAIDDFVVEEGVGARAVGVLQSDRAPGTPRRPPARATDDPPGRAS